MNDQQPTPHDSAHKRPHPVFYVIATALVVIAAGQFVPRGGSDWPGLAETALAQSTSSAGARGVFAFTGQLSKETFGLHVVDVDAMTIWTYEYLPLNGGCLRLAAARSWQYDRYLENLNSCDLPPDKVEKMVEEQRKYKLQELETPAP